MAIQELTLTIQLTDGQARSLLAVLDRRRKDLPSVICSARRFEWEEPAKLERQLTDCHSIYFKLCQALEFPEEHR